MPHLARHPLLRCGRCAIVAHLVRHVERVVLGLVNAPRHLNPLLSGGVEARKSIQQTGSAWLIHTLETLRFGGDG